LWRRESDRNKETGPVVLRAAAGMASLFLVWLLRNWVVTGAALDRSVGFDASALYNGLRLGVNTMSLWLFQGRFFKVGQWLGPALFLWVLMSETKGGMVFFQRIFTGLYVLII